MLLQRELSMQQDPAAMGVASGIAPTFVPFPRSGETRDSLLHFVFSAIYSVSRDLWFCLDQGWLRIDVIFRVRYAHRPFVEPAYDVFQALDAVPGLS